MNVREIEAVREALVEASLSPSTADELRMCCSRLARRLHEAVRPSPSAALVAPAERPQPSLADFARGVVAAVCPTSTDLDAFLVDYYPMVYRTLSDGMDRTARVTRLIERAEVEGLLSAVLQQRRAQATKFLAAVAPTDDDFNALCHNYFPAVRARFSSGMDRLQKTNLLKQYVSPGEIAIAGFRHHPDLAFASAGVWR